MKKIDVEQFKGHTKGPWSWFYNYGRPFICTPHSGRLIVMDFVRKGMQGATCRFSDRKDSMGGIMHEATEFIKDGGEVTSPDAKLLAAAPDLLNEVIEHRRQIDTAPLYYVLRRTVGKTTLHYEYLDYDNLLQDWLWTPKQNFAYQFDDLKGCKSVNDHLSDKGEILPIRLLVGGVADDVI